MIDTYTTNNHHDFNARYAGTYGWLLNDEDPTSKSFVHLIEADGVTLHFDMGGTIVYNSKINSGVRFQFIPVNRGWFDTTEGSVVFLERVPARQWKRGISSSNTQIRDSASLRQQKISYKLLHSVFTKDDHKPEYSPGKAFCISRHFAINEYNAVFCFNTNVGSLYGDNIVLNNSLPILQELRDALRRVKSSFTVEQVNE